MKLQQTQQITWRNFLNWSFTNSNGYVDIIGGNTIWFVDEETRTKEYYGQYEVVAIIHPITNKEIGLKVLLDTKHDHVRMYTGEVTGGRNGFNTDFDRHQGFYLGTLDSVITMPAWTFEMKPVHFHNKDYVFIATMLAALIKELADDMLNQWKHWLEPVITKVETLSDTSHIVTRHFNDSDSDRVTLEIEVTPEIEAIGDILNDDFLAPSKFYKKLAEMKELLKPLCPLDLKDADGWGFGTGLNGKPVICYTEWLPGQKEYHKLRTGHLYYGSYMEGAEDAGDCGTCNGAKCDTCNEVYRDAEGTTHKWPPPSKEE